jgi:RNA polymerase sigma factor (sigma-70 family)
VEASGPVSDEVLWRRSVAGDGEAFGVLFDRHRDRLFRHACHLNGTWSTAEDVVAAAFLELWRRRADVRLVNGSVLPWLLVTATNLNRNVARGTRRYRDFLNRLPREQHSPDVADIAESGPLGVDPRLRAALHTLRRTDVQLFALVVLEDYSLTDAAQLFGLSQSAAKARLHRARSRLREQLGEQPPSDEQLNVGGLR